MKGFYEIQGTRLHSLLNSNFMMEWDPHFGCASWAQHLGSHRTVDAKLHPATHHEKRNHRTQQ